MELWLVGCCPAGVGTVPALQELLALAVPWYDVALVKSLRV